MEDIKVTLVDLGLVHYVRDTARDGPETLRYREQLDPAVAEINQRQ